MNLDGNIVRQSRLDKGNVVAGLTTGPDLSNLEAPVRRLEDCVHEPHSVRICYVLVGAKRAKAIASGVDDDRPTLGFRCLVETRNSRSNIRIEGVRKMLEFDVGLASSLHRGSSKTLASRVRVPGNRKRNIRIGGVTNGALAVAAGSINAYLDEVLLALPRNTPRVRGRIKEVRKRTKRLASNH